MKTCTKCKTERPEADYYRDRRWSAGYRNTICKGCMRAMVTARIRETHYASQKNYARNMPDQFKKEVWRQVYRAVKSGQLVKPANCETCNRVAPLQGHHVDYSKPLEVVWLCVECHQRQHVRV